MASNAQSAAAGGMASLPQLPSPRDERLLHYRVEVDAVPKRYALIPVKIMLLCLTTEWTSQLALETTHVMLFALMIHSNSYTCHAVVLRLATLTMT